MSYLNKLYSAFGSIFFYTGAASLFTQLRKDSNESLVLCYHGVIGPARERTRLNSGQFVANHEFENQMEFIKNHFDVIPLRDIITHIENDIPFQKRSISVTFDDGYQNTFTHAYPILNKFSIPATIFLTTGYIGTRKLTWWQEAELLLQNSEDTLTFDEPCISGTYNLSNSNDRQKLYNTIRHAILHSGSHDSDEILEPIRNRITITQHTNNSTFLSWNEIIEMAKNPLIEFGSHTVSHKILSKMSPAELLPELSNSKVSIEQRLGTNVQLFAYPNGQASDFTVESQYWLKEAGYRCAVTTTHGSINISSNPYHLNRMSISGKDSWPTFVSKLSGIENQPRLITRKLFKKG